MPIPLATALVTITGIYLAIGVCFALWFVRTGCGRIDPTAMHGTRGFRILIFPGAVALWPFLMKRLFSGANHPPEEHNPHRDAAKRIHNS